MNAVGNSRAGNAFRTTQWTQVLAARGESATARHALRELCEVYYAPVEAFVQRYRAGHDDARDLTHAFFAKLLEGNSLTGVERTGGRFRSYLLGAVKHFLADQADRNLAAKRGGGLKPQSLDAPVSGNPLADSEPLSSEVADPHGFPPDAFFDRQWALAIVELAMSRLLAAAQERGEQQRFEILQQWLLPTDVGPTSLAAAGSLGLTEGAFKVAVHRLRQQFRQLVKDQIAASLDDLSALPGELDYLIQALASG